MARLGELQLWWQLLLPALGSTVYMVVVSGFFATLLGLPLGIYLYLCQPGGIHPRRWTYTLLSLLVNIGRSIPFAILMLAIIPFTRLIVGTSVGTTAALVPLTLAALPFFARVVENILGQVERSLLETAWVMGSSTRHLVFKVLLPEALPALVEGVILTLVTLIGYSAMAGLVGGGGLGKVAIQYGYQRFNGPVMFATLVLLLLLVAGVQWLGQQVVRTILVGRGKKV